MSPAKLAEGPGGGASQDGPSHIHAVAQIVLTGVGLGMDSGPLPPGPE